MSKRDSSLIKKENVIIAVVCCGAIFLLAALFLFMFINRKSSTRESESRTVYDEYFTNKGLIADFNVQENVQLCDYKGIPVQYSDIVSDSAVEDMLSEILKDYRQPSNSDSITAKYGDTINIDFTGYIDGEPFEGGDTKGKGYELVLGSGQLIGNFEAQLEGSNPGDKLTITVDFPENYRNEKFRGKTAEFFVTINSIYVTPELTDDFVLKYFSEIARTADEYRDKIEKEIYSEQLSEYLTDYVVENSKILDYPADFLKMLIELNHSTYENQYKFYNEQAYENFGVYPWNTVYEFFELSKEEYEKRVISEAYNTLSYYMVLQAIYQQEGLNISDSTAKEYLIANGYSEESSSEVLAKYGEGFAAQLAIESTVRSFLSDNCIVTREH